MHTSRNCVTNYIHKFNVIVLGRDLFVKWVLIHSLNNLAQLTKYLTAELFFFDTSPADFTVPVPADSLIGVPAGPPTSLALAADSYRSS
ncbi:lysosomal Pro-X carboxypeptidase-like [Dorcoceras hygrometricum]|nr:lysosomal Pro-X carboxypeptidase-like [Dorcoceras hygrometricum]